MNRRFAYLILGTLMLNIIPSATKSQLKKAQAVYPPVQLVNTQQRQLYSKFNKQQYELYISLPDGYLQSDSTYPVLYLSDANTYFGMVTDMTRNLQWGGEMPEAIIVGIGYPINSEKTDEERWAKWLAWRMRDYTPTHNSQMDKDFGDEGIKSGGANTFIKFMEHELFPFIEQNYRVKSKERSYWDSRSVVCLVFIHYLKSLIYSNVT
jgi:predicted alpha/beta superfamily hydrolase